MKSQTLYGLFFLLSLSFAQGQNKQLINLAISSGMIVNITPLKNIYLTRDEIEMQQLGYLRELKEKVDTGILFELVQNSSVLDTSLWRYEEIDSSVLVNDKYVELNFDSVVNQKKLKGRKELKYYKKLVKEYNSQPLKKRVPLSFSRPVFDKTKTYAIIGFRGRNGYGTTLFHLKNNTWCELGIVTRWVF